MIEFIIILMMFLINIYLYKKNIELNKYKKSYKEDMKVYKGVIDNLNKIKKENEETIKVLEYKIVFLKENLYGKKMELHNG